MINKTIKQTILFAFGSWALTAVGLITYANIIIGGLNV